MNSPFKATTVHEIFKNSLKSDALHQEEFTKEFIYFVIYELGTTLARLIQIKTNLKNSDLMQNLK